MLQDDPMPICAHTLSSVAKTRFLKGLIFQEMAKGDLKLLQHRFRSLVRGCEAVYRERLKAEKEYEDGE